MKGNRKEKKVLLGTSDLLHNFFRPSFDTELKTSPTIHEQKQKLERAKMGDLLKAKIQQRPDRQELVRQHILEGNYNFYVEKHL